MPHKYDGIIFDIDGTLWDSTDVCAIGYNRVITRLLGEEYPHCDGDSLKKLFGKTTAQIGAGLFPDRSEKEQYEFCLMCIEEEMICLKETPPEPYPGLREALEKLYGEYDMFIVSNCERGYIELFLESSGLGHFFKDHLCLGDTGLAKKENIEKIIETHGLKKAIYVGDVQGDSDSAHGAGIPIVYATYGFGNISDAEYSIDSIGELPSVFGL